MTNSALFPTTTQTEEKTYPTPLEVLNKLIENIQKDDISDPDEIVYDAISDWDEKYEGDTEWYDEECENFDGDMKDSLRDFIENILEEEGIDDISEINKDFLKRPTVIDALKDW